MLTRPLLTLVLIGSVLSVPSVALEPSAAQSDLDAFMEKVLARRDDNWKKLQQYVLEEKEAFDLSGPGRFPLWGMRREYSWFIRDGIFVRSPITADGVKLSEADRNAIMHIELPILAGHVLMGTDMLESMGHQLRIGNNTTINLEPDTRAETERLYALLSQDSEEFAPLADMPWGAYWGTCLDRFGIRWMFNCYEAAA